MESVARHGEDKPPLRPKQPGHLREHHIDVGDVLEHRVGKDPVKAAIWLRHAVSGDSVDCRVDAEVPRLRRLSRVRVDANQFTRAGVFEQYASEEPIAAPKVEAPALGKTQIDDLADFDSTPYGGGGLKRVLAQEPDD